MKMLRCLFAVAVLLAAPALVFAQGFGYQGPGGAASGASVTTGTSTPSAGGCDAADEVGDLYLQSGDPATVNLQLFRCTQTGPSSYAWHPTAHMVGTTPPATCTAATAPIFFDTDAAAGSNLFGCTADDTWTLLGGGMGDPGGNGVMVRTAANTSTARTIVGSTGITCSNCDGVSGNPTISVDRASVVYKGSGTADPPAECGDTGDTYQLQDHYLETDTNEDYVCEAVDTWGLTNTYETADISGAGWFVDEDTMTSDSATKVPSQQSVKAYVDNNAGGSVDYATQYSMVDEFAIGKNDDGEIGDLGWQRSLEGSGASITNISHSSSVANHHGVIQLVGGSSDDAGVYLWGSYFNSGDYASEDWEFNIYFEPEDAVTDTFIAVGLQAGAPTSASAAIRAIYDTDRSHTAWVFQICDSSTSGCQSAGDDTNADTVTSTISPAADDHFRIRIRRLTSGVGGNPTIYFSAGNAGAMETELTFCSSGCDEDLGNIPSAQIRPTLGIVNRAAATSKRLNLDLYTFTASGLVRY